MMRYITGLIFFSVIAVIAALISCTNLTSHATSTLAPASTPISTPKGLLPLVDAHNHLPRGVKIEQVIKLMDEAGVQAMTLMTVYYQAKKAWGQGISDENLVLEFYKQHPNRIIPILGMQRPVLTSPDRWESPDEAAKKLLKFVESKLQTGVFRGLGEIILWHYPYSFPGGPLGYTLKIPADTPLMKRLLDLAAKYLVPVIIHYEIDNESLSALKRMLEYGRSTTIVLAHAGRPDPPTLKAILDEYPNVYCDLGGMTRNGGYGRISGGEGGKWTVKNPIDNGFGHLILKWKALYEQYADRFMIGTDLAHPEPWASMEYYKQCIDEFRSLLSDLSPEVAEKIGFRNAQKLFGSNASSTEPFLFP